MIHSELAEEEIDAIRLQSHLVGPRSWDAYSKAKYLNYLHNSAYLTANQIVDFCGGKQREIQSYISAYSDMEEFYRPLIESDEHFDHTRFSAFVELQKPRIQRALLEAEFSKKDFAQWIQSKKIYKNEEVRHLPKIFADKKAKGIFKRTPTRAVEKALQVLDAPSPEAALQDATLYQLATETMRRIGKMEFKDYLDLKSDQESDEIQAIVQARDSLNELISEIAE